MQQPLPSRLSTFIVAVAVVATAVVAGSPGPVGAADGDGDGPARPSAADAGLGGTYRLTLLTGDVVHVDEVGDGRRAVTVEPGEGRDRIGFHQMEVDDDLVVVPLDVVPLMASGQLDQSLFNINTLIEEGHHDAATGELSIIIRYADEARQSGEASTFRGASTGLSLESINSQAFEVDKSQAGSFWGSVQAEPAATAQAGAELDPQVERIWLDRTVEATLDHSVAQVGAPHAWDAGFDGKGVTVAVLDTGIDDQHPDLIGKIVAERNFSDSPDAEDRLGHGTHVAATVAGTGAASQGQRAGVAPGAELLSAKVLDDRGSGDFSWIIEGMEWATDSGADIVNMSLGGEPTDGTDPLSLAVNELTQQTGSLFVVAAGNSGPDPSTVGSPGSADAALTVGAVGRDDVVAHFSSRGPRHGDLAIKPDITGPGVRIVAARASGTSMGNPVDANYTAASGTSMATPHVAGAAALLIQRHPDWTAEDLKDGLISTAATAEGHSVYAQGGGRVDAARAVEQRVHATGTLHLGTFTAGEDDHREVTRTVTYRNTGQQGVELSLDLALRTADGEAPPAGAVRVEPETLVVPPGQAATAEAIVDVGRLQLGQFTGHLTAQSSEVTVHTTLGVIKEPPVHAVTFTGIGPDGEPALLTPLSVRGQDPRFDHVRDVPPGEEEVLHLAEGTYNVFANLSATDEHGGAAYAMIVPSLEVTGETEVVLDAREAAEVVIETPEPARPTSITSYYAFRELHGRRIGHAVMYFADVNRIHVTPTEPVTVGRFEFDSRWQLVPPMLAARVHGGHGPDLDLYYLGNSPALEGRRILPLVDVGAGRAEDYRDRSVDGGVALVSPPDPPDYEHLTSVAADAGAAMVILVPPPGYGHWSEWDPEIGERLPTMAAMVSRPQGAQLLDLVDDGHVRLRLEGSTDQPYLYDVMQVSEGHVPPQIVHTIDPSNSATVTTHYHAAGTPTWAAEQRFGWRPWMGAAINQEQRIVKTPQVRQEIVSAPGTLWQHRVRHDRPLFTFGVPLYGGLTQAPRTYAASRTVAVDWHRAVIRPAIPRKAGLDSYRVEDAMTFRIPEFTDAASSHFGRADTEESFGFEAPDEVTARLYRDEELVFEGEAAWGTFPAVPHSAQYRLELEVDRDDPAWEVSPTTETSWTFASQRPVQGQELLPLLQVDYEPDVDLGNRARANRKAPLRLTVRHQDGLARPDVAEIAVWASFDDGATWQPLRVSRQAPDRFQALVPHPRPEQDDGFVSLRVRAVDVDGNEIDQTVERAYALTGP